MPRVRLFIADDVGLGKTIEAGLILRELLMRQRIVGIVVDSVSDVMQLTPDDLRAAPEVESMIGSDAVLGLRSLGDRMLILLDIEKLMSGEDMGLVSDV